MEIVEQEQIAVLHQRRPMRPRANRRFAERVMTLPEDVFLNPSELADDLLVTTRTITVHTIMPDGIPSVEWANMTRYRVGSVRKWLLARERFPRRRRRLTTA